MRGTERRLERIAVSLTPQQAVLAWMEEAQQYPTLADYSHSLVGEPEQAFPLHAIPHQVAEAVRTAMKGQPHDVIWRTVRGTVRDGGFLVYLVLGANGHVRQERRAQWLQLALIAERQRPALRGWEVWDAARVRKWNDRARKLAYEVFREAFAMELLARRYFASRSPLFPATAAELEEQKGRVEELIWCSNEALELEVYGPKGQKARRGLLLDLDHLTGMGREGAKLLAEYLVHLAKAQALLMIGEDEQAFALVEPHI